MRIYEKILGFFDTAEEKEIFAECKPMEVQLKHDFKVDTAVRNLMKAMRFWLWCSLLVDGVRCLFSAYAIGHASGEIPLSVWIFVALYWVVFVLTVLCIFCGLLVKRNAPKHYRLILFCCDAYMLIFLLRGVVFTVLDLESGIIGFSLIGALFISCYTLYYRPLVTLCNILITMGAFFASVYILQLQELLDPLVLFRLSCVALLAGFTSVARYRSKYKVFLKERTLILKSDQLNRLNAQLEENRKYIEQQNQKLQIISNTDVLTGLGSRHSFVRESMEILRQAAQKGCFVTAAIVDIDNFKAVNDTYGHTMGDACLKAVGEVFQSITSDSVHAFRLGGDELIVLFYDQSRSDAFLVMNRVVKAVSNLQIPKFDRTITLSVGIHSAIPTADSHIDEYIEKADVLLYEAKATGRNKIVTTSQSKGENNDETT